MKICPKCGSNAKSKFCPECGTNLLEVEEFVSEIEISEDISDEDKGTNVGEGELIIRNELSSESTTPVNCLECPETTNEESEGGINLEPTETTFQGSASRKTAAKYNNAIIKFYEKMWFVILMLIVFFPVGVYLMWKQKKFNKLVRIITSIILGLNFLFWTLIVALLIIPCEHEWAEATCTEPSTCNRCGSTTGDLNPHKYEGQSCTKDGVCVDCGATIDATGHKWKDATCTSASKCKTCGKSKGKALGHTTSMGTCSRCGEKIFKAIENSGYGDKVVTDISLGDGIFVAKFKHTGSSNFIVKFYDSDGNDYDLLINEIGNYKGTVLLSGEGEYMFEISADGYWEYEIKALEKTSKESFTGSGDYVTPIFSSSNKVWKFKHDGNSNFAVWLYSSDGRDLLVNEIGKYDGETIVNIPSGGSAFFEINADGNWSATPAN